MTDKLERITDGKGHEIVYGSWYEVNGGFPEGVIEHSLGPLGERMLKLERE